MSDRGGGPWANRIVAADPTTHARVREGVRLVHSRAREFAAAAEYDQFYGGQPAPLPEGAAAIWGE